MKGKLLTYSVADNNGLILGADDKRYAFAGIDWRSTALPRIGMALDFDPQGEIAVDICSDLTVPVANDVAEAMPGLYRSSDDKMIGGVCGGFAHKMGIPVPALRFVTFFLLPFGILIYPICWILFPSRPTRSQVTTN